jgi:RHH-type proline utilization regulon transcriptional repressor/proline dehydrogenase/delta 1-pyrroline-5-carboxylate dehydrogenase
MPPPFARFAPPIRPADELRGAITAATRRPESECLPPLLAAATLPAPVRDAARETADKLIHRLRARPARSGVQALVQEYALSSEEGVALMCLAEALLRIPDTATRDALIRDKIADGDWAAHIGDGRSLFVNAATWGLVVTGMLTGSADDRGLSAALTRLIARLGEPVIRQGVDVAMRLMGEQFVLGQTIGEALRRARAMEAKGFAYSYDMLGEAALTADDAARYYADYERAIRAIGEASAGRGVQAGPGISIKLSALHPRYSRAQAERVMRELLPRVRALALLARSYDIGFNIDAEEADRLELSLDLLQSLAEDGALAGWDGLGFVVQAYGKRCPFVIDFVVALARANQRRIMVRLVKGAYWDAEIKRAQVDGLAGFPVFTRKAYTDLSYIACARKLLAARDAVFPQFATHNAQTLATIHAMAGPDFAPGDWEFQCLHGMGERLYEEVVGKHRLDRPCRIYAPVGTHETLLAYLVRRLLENGANSSFVNRIADPSVSVEALIADPVEEVAAMPMIGAPHPAIALPADLYEARRNSAGLDLSDESVLAALSDALAQSAAEPVSVGTAGQRVVNPADRRDVVGTVAFAKEGDAAQAVRITARAVAGWSSRPVEERAAMLERAADVFERDRPALMALAIREAGKSAANAVAEVREAVDFLRYYAGEARRTIRDGQRPLGPVVCISPWNFPLSIFTGQVAAALVAGNAVLAKPAEETPLIAARAVALLHAAGVPEEVLQFVPGDGAIGAALVAAPETAGVMFTGSNEVARLIQKQLAPRTAADGRPIPLVAETGGQNAMIVDSSALAEQVVADAVSSAFDSAGQRCSALRVLCLQEEIAERTLAMLKGALAELSVGRPDTLRIDIGPVITAEAQANIAGHIATMREAGHRVHQPPLDEACAWGHFIPPTIIEIDAMAELTREVFGPVLHVLRYRRQDLPKLIEAINATGYGLTFGLHTRLDETVERVTEAIAAGNLYVNRNIIGAVVGVQPFGGRGLSGTGPKAGGPLYLSRLVADPAVSLAWPGEQPALTRFAEWLEARGVDASAERARAMGRASPQGLEIELPGPVGERNLYACHPRGRIALVARSEAGLHDQVAAVLATGNRAVIAADTAEHGWLADLPEALASLVQWSDAALSEAGIAATLVESAADVPGVAEALAARAGPIVPLQLASAAGGYVLAWLVEEVSTSINTAAAGGNASLMAIV